MAIGKGLAFGIRATDRTRGAFAGVQSNIRKTQGLQRSWNAGLNSNRRAVQQFGFQMSDFAIQVAGGQSAMLAFTQQGGQMLQFFGPAGSIMAAFVAVFGSLAIAFTRSGAALSDLLPALGVLKDDFSALGGVLSNLKETMIDFANLTVNNLDRILIVVGVVVSWYGIKLVKAFVLARFAGEGLAKTMLFLSRVMARTIVLGLIIGLSELIYQFSRLSQAAGGFGEATALLFNVFKEAFDNMGAVAGFFKVKVQLAWVNIMTKVYSVLASINERTNGTVNKIIGAFVGAAKAIVAAFSSLPAAMGAIGGLMMNALVDKIEGGLGGVVGAVNSVLSALRIPTIPAPDLSGWEADVDRSALQVGAAAADAFSEGFNGNYIGNGTSDDGVMQALEQERLRLLDVAERMGANMVSQMPSLQRLLDLLGSINDERIDVRDWFGGTDDDDGGGGGGGSGAGNELAEDAETAKKAFEDLTKTISGAFSTMWNGITKEGKSFADAMLGVITTILDKMAEMVLSPIWETIATSLTGALIGTPTGGGLSGGWLSGLWNALPSYDGGGSTGNGSRTGGIDGQGGSLAIVHPNETVIDHTSGGRVATTSVAPKVEVVIHENGGGDETEVTQSGNRIDVYLRNTMSNAVGEGGLDKAMKKRFGLSPRAA